MVPLIEDQIHQFLIDKEEQRCTSLEIENGKNKETKDKKVKRRVIPKPWVRPNDAALCQETDLLMMVNEYDYDLSDKTFQDYCCARGILHVAGVPQSTRWVYFINYRKRTRSDYLKDPCFQFAEEVNGKRYRYTDKEIEIGWKIIQLGRAKFQDCWESFTKRPIGRR
jgi:hypothetical protein